MENLQSSCYFERLLYFLKCVIKHAFIYENLRRFIKKQENLE